MIHSIVIGIVILVYLVDLIVTLINYQHRHQPIPENARDIYDQA